MYKLIEIGKNYFFCDICGKCYIYKGSYEKHKLICDKKNDNDNSIISDKDSYKIEEIDSEDECFNVNELDNEPIVREKLINKTFTKDEIVEMICPFYLFFCILILGFIKGIFQGFK